MKWQFLEERLVCQTSFFLASTKTDVTFLQLCLKQIISLLWEKKTADKTLISLRLLYIAKKSTKETLPLFFLPKWSSTWIYSAWFKPAENHSVLWEWTSIIPSKVPKISVLVHFACQVRMLQGTKKVHINFTKIFHQSFPSGFGMHQDITFETG